MSIDLFELKPLSKPSFFQKLFKQFPEENAVVELNNLLAISEIRMISQSDIRKIEDRYLLKLNKEFMLNLEEFYAVYLNHCLKDLIISDKEMEDLRHLKYLLNLDERTIEKLHQKIGANIYKKTFQEVVSDGRITEEEKAFIIKLEETLCLSKELSDKISSEVKKAFFENHITQILTDQILSPTEEREFEAISESLNLRIQFDDKTQEQFRKLKLYWALENYDLPVIQPDIVIQKSEVCHMKIQNVKWYDLRTARKSSTNIGYSENFKMIKEFYLHSDSSSISNFNTDVMKLIDTGTLYLTNKRIIFTGHKKNSIIRIDKILNFIPYFDGIEVNKETGKSPVLQILQNTDVFCMILERLLNNKL